MQTWRGWRRRSNSVPR